MAKTKAAKPAAKKESKPAKTTQPEKKQANGKSAGKRGKKIVIKHKEEELPEPTPADFEAIGIEGKFTAKERKFIYHYVLPGPGFMNQAMAAEKAGYSKKNAKIEGYRVRRRQDIDTAIKNILESRISVNLEEKFQRAMSMLDSRTFFDLSDYVEKKTITIKVGKEEFKDIEVEAFKNLSDLTKEQLKAVDGIDYRGVNGTRILVMPDRVKSLIDIINMRNKAHGAVNENEFDIETTADIIKGELSVKITARKSKEELSRTAGYLEPPGEQAIAIEEL